MELVGLGEATHGSAEFQEIKLDVFKKLVKDYGFTAFALEADYGDCLAANAYIQGGEGDAREIVNNMKFAMYHTGEMADILEWMRDYNQAVNENKRLRFYGFDMQNPDMTVPYLLDFMAENNIEADTSELEKLLNNESRVDGEEIKKEAKVIRTEIEKQSKDYFDLQVEAALQMTTTISQCIDNCTISDYSETLTHRDNCMAENGNFF